MGIHKSRLHANIGLLLILLIGFGFGALLLMQSKNIESPRSIQSSSAIESMPGMDMTANEMKVTPQNNSPITLLSIFLGINAALIVSAAVLKRVRSKRRVVPRVCAPTLEFESGSK